MSKRLLTAIALVVLLFVSNSYLSAQTGVFWRVSDEELKIPLTKLTSKQQKRFATNRFEPYRHLTQYERLIRIAESIVPNAQETEKIDNITSSKVNEYSAKALAIKDGRGSYEIAVDFRKMPIGNAIQTVRVVNSKLGYGYICGPLCCFSTTLKKTVIFAENSEEVLGVMFPINEGSEC